MARLITRSPGAYMSTAFAVVAFGVAFGYLEAAVVVYLRTALGLAPAGLVPVHDPAAFGAFEGVEVARELATLVMIGAAGWLAGRSGLERLAWAAVIFGAWDIVYYLGLWLVTGWPPTATTWDVLFLVPMPWVGPVWAPMVVSAALVVVGLVAARRIRAGQSVVVGPIRAIAALVGGGLVILSFLLDANRVLAGDGSAWTGWPLFWAGMALATAATATALTRPSRARRDASGSIMEPEAGRPSAHRTDQLISTRRFVDMADKVKDPVCGMEIRPENAARHEHEGRTFYFCSQACHDTFVNDPHRYGHPAEEHRDH